MARLDRAPGEAWKGKKPPKGTGYSIVGYRGTTYIRRTVTKRGAPRTELHKAWVINFVEDTKRAKHADPCAANYALNAAPGTGWFARDIILTALNGKLFRHQGEKRVTTPTAKVHRSTSESLSAGVFKTLTPNVKDFDNNTAWNASSHPERLTCKSAGLYLIGGNVSVTPVNGMNIHVGIVLNGGAEIAQNVGVSPGSYGPTLPLVTIYYFHLNDYITMQVVASSGGVASQLLDFWMLAITPEAVI